ncbi:cytochrome c biogenesis CcdA family protein [Halostella salina]|uniref:cytochrome c biogenesis CcdA family protein n=1 Tax=Halostella salina TaxID=1547897 RepID=UPI000EF8349B|nr:cytochrome c biogenesis protein CcdA [Halostella salina]
MSDAAFAGTVGFAVGAGLTTFFAPCAYPLLPGYVGYYASSDGGDVSHQRPLIDGVVAAGGAVLAFVAVGAVVFLLGQRAVADIALVEPLVGVGLVALGVVTLADRAPEVRVPLPERPESRVQYGVFGAVYAVAAAGCVVPVFLGVVIQAIALGPVRGTVAFAAYALSVAAPLVAVTLLASAGLDVWRDLGRYAGSVRLLAGTVMVGAGCWQLYLSVVVLDVL